MLSLSSEEPHDFGNAILRFFKSKSYDLVKITINLLATVNTFSKHGSRLLGIVKYSHTLLDMQLICRNAI